MNTNSNRFQLKNVGHTTHLVDTHSHNKVIKTFTVEDGDLGEEMMNELNHRHEVVIDLIDTRAMCAQN